MKNDFKINAFFSENGDEIEKILANYLLETLKK